MKPSVCLLLFLFLVAACGAESPATGSPDFNATAVEAQLNAQRVSQFQTATAQSDMNTAISKQMDITSTAAALIVEQIGWTATAQMSGTQTAIPMTATAQSWTPTPVPTATPDATQTLVSKQSEADQIAIANKVKRDNMTNTLYAVTPYIVGFLLFFLLLGAVVAFAFVFFRRLSFVPAQTDDRGKTRPLINVVDGVWSDIDRVTNGAGSLRHSDLTKLLPQITAARQDATTERAQMVDLASRGLPARAAQNKSTALQTITNQAAMQNRFESLAEGQNPPAEVIDGEILKVLENDWKESKHDA